MRFGAHHTNDNVIFNYNIDGRILKFVSSHKNLGVLIESSLRFHDLIVCCSKSRRIGWRAITIHCLPLPKFYGVLVCISLKRAPLGAPFFLSLINMKLLRSGN